MFNDGAWRGNFTCWARVKALVMVGCGEPSGVPHACGCPWLTDFDDETSITNSACASTHDRAARGAKACAQGEATVLVQTCTYMPVPSRHPCWRGTRLF